ncbi:MAG: hypothetical protein GC203_09390 [Phenylobacterium sp.]|uniref:hypothetical protein n=1 Tax=Phenylobacterium sp. TaxID=1871053 RepID=UPI0025D65DCB|nr:hypothetical protein [Phenylobacterium sp.]MBI1198065.1 hypothetical protein [Phenylobacterium sp.]
MLDALDITEEEAAGLAELAQHDLAMARHFAGRAQAAEDPDEANRLARSYQRAARSYRQTLALKARLKRDLAQAEAEKPRPRPGGQAVARRIGALRTALLRLAWDEAERPESEEAESEPDLETFAWYRDDIEGVVAEECVKDAFCDEPLDDHVARVGLAMGFDPEALAAWRDLADPPDAALAFKSPEPVWRGSG